MYIDTSAALRYIHMRCKIVTQKREFRWHIHKGTLVTFTFTLQKVHWWKTSRTRLCNLFIYLFFAKFVRHSEHLSCKLVSKLTTFDQSSKNEHVRKKGLGPFPHVQSSGIVLRPALYNINRYFLLHMTNILSCDRAARLSSSGSAMKLSLICNFSIAASQKHCFKVHGNVHVLLVCKFDYENLS